MKVLLNLESSTDDTHVEFGGDSLSLFMSHRQWEHQGSPDIITVTVEPGNKLRI